MPLPDVLAQQLRQRVDAFAADMLSEPGGASLISARLLHKHNSIEVVEAAQ